MRRLCWYRWALASVAVGSLWLACEQYATQLRVHGSIKGDSDEQQLMVVPQTELFTRWKTDGLDGLGFDDISSATSALLEKYQRLPTMAPCWQIRNASRCMPSFLLIGTMKAGTTALSSYLQLHEDIYMSAKKEPGFFNGGRACDGMHCHAGTHAHNLRFYFSLFPSLDPADPAGLQAAVFEATPTYLFSSYRTPVIIRAWLPDAKLLVLVRDPVERAYSQYQLGLTLLAEDRSRPHSRQVCSRSALEFESFDRLVQRALLLFRDCVVHLQRASDSKAEFAEAEERMYYKCKQRPLRDNPCDNVVTPSSLLNPGLYSYHLERFLRKFPREQLHVIDTVELGSHPQETLRKVFTYLDVSQPDINAWPPQVFRRRCPRFFGIKTNKEYRYHSDASKLVASDSGTHNHYDSNAADWVTNTKDCESYPPMRNQTRAALKEFYNPHNARFYRLLGKDYGW